MPLEGMQMSHYRVLAKLGQGSYGSVYRAEDVRLGRQVALKCLAPGRVADARARERFRAEARAVAALEHPHICLLYELDEHDGEPLLVMQLVEGETLRHALARGPLGDERAREVVVALASALSTAHARGLLHRDVKSENVLLGNDGGIKLSDFGLARLVEADGPTTTGTLVGTPAYLAPELVRGRPASEASDQFALGVVAYECLTGRLPFKGETVAAILFDIVHCRPQPPSRVRPELGTKWDDVVTRALASDPLQRFGSVAEFGRAVARTVPAAATGSTRDGAQRALAPSLAVLYFENLSSDPDSDYFCAGLTEDILTDLAKVPGLKVASRNAVARLRGQSVDIARVAEDLGVGAVLEGSVRRAGGRLRISAQLIDAASGFHLWAERYDRTLEDVFAVQAEISHAIATALSGTVAADEMLELMQTRPAGFTAYDLHLRGRDAYVRFTREDMLEALRCFEDALKIDPDYALAWAGVANACAQMHNKLWDMDPAWLARGVEAGERAVALGPMEPEAHKALALARYTLNDCVSAAACARRALAINPRYTGPMDTLGWTALVLADPALAERCFRRAIALDPHYAYSHGSLAHVLLHTRRYREAVDHLHRWQRLGPGRHYQTAAYAERAWALANLGDLAAADEEIREARAGGLSGGYIDAADALVAARSGQEERARRLIAQQQGVRPDYYHAAFVLAEAAAFLGDAPAAARILGDFERTQACHQKYWAYRIAPGLSRIRKAPELRAWLGERGRAVVWPLEAPPLSPADRAEFTEYRETSGLPVGDEPL